MPDRSREFPLVQKLSPRRIHLRPPALRPRPAPRKQRLCWESLGTNRRSKAGQALLPFGILPLFLESRPPERFRRDLHIRREKPTSPLRARRLASRGLFLDLKRISFRRRLSDPDRK